MSTQTKTEFGDIDVSFKFSRCDLAQLCTLILFSENKHAVANCHRTPITSYGRKHETLYTGSAATAKGIFVIPPAQAHATSGGRQRTSTLSIGFRNLLRTRLSWQGRGTPWQPADPGPGGATLQGEGSTLVLAPGAPTASRC